MCVVTHLTLFHIYFNYVNIRQKVKDALYARQGTQKSLPIPTEKILWDARIGIFILNITLKK